MFDLHNIPIANLSIIYIIYGVGGRSLRGRRRRGPHNVHVAKRRRSSNGSPLPVNSLFKTFAHTVMLVRLRGNVHRTVIRIFYMQLYVRSYFMSVMHNCNGALYILCTHFLHQLCCFEFVNFAIVSVIARPYADNRYCLQNCTTYNYYEMYSKRYKYLLHIHTHTHT